jgi:3-deoxy-manno-octulosonate cytidylyltransferase (CMP-KDO synthetase)
MKFIGVIPARFASTRFPGKPLVIIDGVSMIKRVYQRVEKAGILSYITVATDDQRIFNHVAEFGNVVLTSPDHPSGTDRCNEAIRSIGEKLTLTHKDVVINIQGDEPFIEPAQIEELCRSFDNPDVNIATLKKRITGQKTLFDENVVKVITDADGRAIYFSRFPLPFLRGVSKEIWASKGNYFKHIGVYAYRLDALGKITSLKQTQLEKAESLEQLRWLENGFNIQVSETQFESFGIDTPEDIDRLYPKNSNK